MKQEDVVRYIISLILATIFVVAFTLLSGCGDHIKGKACGVTNAPEGTIIRCPNGSVSYIKDGKDAVTDYSPIYLGDYCERTGLRIGEELYIVNGRLIKLDKLFYVVYDSKNSKCSVRKQGDRIDVQKVVK